METKGCRGIEDTAVTTVVSAKMSRTAVGVSTSVYVCFYGFDGAHGCTRVSLCVQDFM